MRSSSATYTTMVLAVIIMRTSILSASLVRHVSLASTFRRRPERSRSMKPKFTVNNCAKIPRRR